jgi:nucleotide-binding universal stress UspA family protein
MTAHKRRPTIVVVYDGSEVSRAAVDLAARRAGRRGLVLVAHAYELGPEFLPLPDHDQRLGERHDHGQSLLDALLLVGNDELLDREYETVLLARGVQRRLNLKVESQPHERFGRPGTQARQREYCRTHWTSPKRSVSGGSGRVRRSKTGKRSTASAAPMVPRKRNSDASRPGL